MKAFKLLRLLALVATLTLSTRAADSDLKQDLAKMQGKWKATTTTDQGTGKWTLEIKENKSKILIETESGDVVFKGENEFKLEEFGKFKAYTYFNLKILSGNNEGETRLIDGKSKSSAYKIDEDTMTTVSGFSADDKEKPLLIKWEKVSK